MGENITIKILTTWEEVPTVANVQLETIGIVVGVLRCNLIQTYLGVSTMDNNRTFISVGLYRIGLSGRFSHYHQAK